MATDKETIAVYDEKVNDYSAAFAASEADASLQRFAAELPDNAKVLDWGCGPGSHAAAMQAQGFEVTATDASTAMVNQARTHAGVNVLQAEFADLQDRDTYDGIWANFSLLHEPRGKMPENLGRIAQALKPGGVLHIGMKSGTGEARDHLGRFYTFYTPEELRGLLADAGFEVFNEVTGEGAGLAGTVDPWVEMLARLNPSA